MNYKISTARAIPVTSLLLMMALCGQSARATGEEDFRCPLLGPFAVRREDPKASDGTYGVYQVVKSFGPAGCEFIVTKVRKVGVSGGAIVGTTETGFFILET